MFTNKKKKKKKKKKSKHTIKYYNHKNEELLEKFF